MDRYGEKPKFEVKDAIGQTPFERKAAGAFFAKWCEVNDSIVPIVVDRKEWEEKTKDGILQKNEDKKHTLYLPRDLRLWEMVGIMEAVDTNTFATTPERQKEVKEKILDLGKTFQNVGIYIAKRKDGIGEGKEIAEALAVELCDYGQSLVSGKKAAEGTTIEALAKRDLSEEETVAVDHFLAGDSLVEAREKKAIKRGMGVEVMRQKTLNQFFGVAQKAFELSDKSALGELKENPIKLEPWLNDAPIHETFLAKIYRALERNIEMPKTELHASIFRRGMELLRSSMPFDSLPANIKESILHWENGEKTLREALGVEQMKAELEEMRKSGDLAKISEFERKIVDKIQEVISEYSRSNDIYNPSKIVANQAINCVGASMLGSALMSEIGLKHLVGGVPSHSILLLVTSDKEVEWRDMLNPWANEPLIDSIPEEVNMKRRRLIVNDLVKFSDSPKENGLRFAIGEKKYRDKMPWLDSSEGVEIEVCNPEQGLRQFLLNTVGNALTEEGFKEEALVAYRQAVALDPTFSYAYNGLGNILDDLGRHSEAVEVFRRAIAIDPAFADPYNGLGIALSNLGLNFEAIVTFKRALEIDPNDYVPYNGLGNAFRSLGRDGEAVEAFKKFIKLADKDVYGEAVKYAEEIVAKFEGKKITGGRVRTFFRRILP